MKRTHNTLPAWVRATSVSEDETWFDARRVLTFTQRAHYTDVILMTDDMGVYYPVTIRENADWLADAINQVLQMRSELDSCGTELDSCRTEDIDPGFGIPIVD